MLKLALTTFCNFGNKMATFHLAYLVTVPTDIKVLFQVAEIVFPLKNDEASNSGQSYKHFVLINYDSRVVISGKMQMFTTLES